MLMLHQVGMYVINEERSVMLRKNSLFRFWTTTNFIPFPPHATSNMIKLFSYSWCVFFPCSPFPLTSTVWPGRANIALIQGAAGLLCSMPGIQSYIQKGRKKGKNILSVMIWKVQITLLNTEFYQTELTDSKEKHFCFFSLIRFFKRRQPGPEGKMVETWKRESLKNKTKNKKPRIDKQVTWLQIISSGGEHSTILFRLGEN